MTTKTISKFCLIAALGLASVAFTSAKDDELKSGGSDPKTTDTGVVINGVKWATRNVDAFGTFAATPESAGMFYQWNRPQAWNATDTIVTGWDNTLPTGTTWEKANDPCPTGWRVPTLEEQESLFKMFDTEEGTEKVTDEWTTQNGVIGRRFTDKATGASLFLPAVGYRFWSHGKLVKADMQSNYWSSTWHHYRNALYACNIYVGPGDAYISSFGEYSHGYSVRCVSE